MRARTRLILGLGIPVLIVVMLLAAWGIDASSASGKVPRNVTLGDRDISKLAEDELAATVADMAERFSEVEVSVRTGDRTYKVEAGTLGLKLDQTATIAAALALDDETSLPARPIVWMSSFVDERKAPVSYTVDGATLEAAFTELGGNAAPTEPSLVAGTDAMTVISGTAGRSISAEGVEAQLLRRARSGEQPIIVDANVIDKEPTVGDADAQALADKVNLATTDGMIVTAGDKQAALDGATVRTWVGSEVTDGTMDLTVDGEAAIASLTDALPLDAEVKNASITLTNGTPTITPGKNGQACCAPDSADRLLTAINNGESSVAIDLEIEEPGFSTEDAEALGIKEPVGTITEWNGQPQVKSFTTYHDCCAGRVTNIHRMADIVRGTIVKPGETFSINDVVGERTEANGFVPAGAIAYGEHVDEVGGGVSQFATTMFNAAYFAGLDITVSQAHSEYFSRYPRGREATMGFPNPDLAWDNDTPYGVMVWTSYTDTSLTITLYSTQYAYSEQTGSSESRSGNCTVVSTERTTYYPDEANDLDTFTARYRDAGKTSC